MARGGTSAQPQKGINCESLAVTFCSLKITECGSKTTRTRLTGAVNAIVSARNVSVKRRLNGSKRNMQKQAALMQSRERFTPKNSASATPIDSVRAWLSQIFILGHSDQTVRRARAARSGKPVREVSLCACTVQQSQPSAFRNHCGSTRS